MAASEDKTAWGNAAASALAPVARLGAGVAGRPKVAPEEALWAGPCPGCPEGAGKAGAPNAEAPKGLFAPGLCGCWAWLACG